TVESLSLVLRDYATKMVMFVFFLQAEDGIRDFHVTGVQTCALPISPNASSSPGSGPLRGPTPHSNGPRLIREPAPHPSERPRARSEERRVGKRGRHGWAPEHQKSYRADTARTASAASGDSASPHAHR